MGGKRLARLLLLSAALLAARAQEDGDVADAVEAEAEPAPAPSFLVVSKSMKEAPAVVGGNVTVTLQMFNAGESPAVDIQLRDAAWEGAKVTLLDGSAEAKVAALAPGANASHTYTLRAHAPGFVLGNPAKVQYRDATTKKPQVAYSQVAHGEVISVFKSLLAKAVGVGAWLSLGILRTEAAWGNTIALVVVLGSLLGVNSLVLRVRASLKRHKRVKAAAELGVKSD